MDAPQGAWTLKVELQGDLRRLKDWPAAGHEPTEPALRAAVQQLFGLGQQEAEALIIRYKDDEGDACTLTDRTLPDALAPAAGAGAGARVLRLLCEAPDSPAAASAAPSASAESVGTGAATAQTAATAINRLSQRVMEETWATASELRSAFTDPGGLHSYSETLQGRLAERMQEARAAAAEAREAATQASSHASQGDARATLGLLAAAAVPATVLALGPGRCVRLGLLAAGAMAAASLAGGGAAAAAGAAGAAASEGAGEPGVEAPAATNEATDGAEAPVNAEGGGGDEAGAERRPTSGAPRPEMD